MRTPVRLDHAARNVAFSALNWHTRFRMQSKVLLQLAHSFPDAKQSAAPTGTLVSGCKAKCCSNWHTRFRMQSKVLAANMHPTSKMQLRACTTGKRNKSLLTSYFLGLKLGLQHVDLLPHLTDILFQATNEGGIIELLPCQVAG